MSQHTPAPWVYCPKRQTVRTAKEHQPIADVRGWGWLQYQPNGEAIQDLNGYLIAAAPELLAALEAMAFQGFCGCNHAFCKNCKLDAQCKTVIAKAQGKT
jgi:hypothetical protein